MNGTESAPSNDACGKATGPRLSPPPRKKPKYIFWTPIVITLSGVALLALLMLLFSSGPTRHVPCPGEAIAVEALSLAMQDYVREHGDLPTDRKNPMMALCVLEEHWNVRYKELAAQKETSTSYLTRQVPFADLVHFGDYHPPSAAERQKGKPGLIYVYCVPVSQMGSSLSAVYGIGPDLKMGQWLLWVNTAGIKVFPPEAVISASPDQPPAR